ncbi:MAG: hypothetical protein Q8O15_08060, partial [Rectinemataceae bacterium]|nr:hypothetical protein [Rectinemataceae bacterium]
MDRQRSGCSTIIRNSFPLEQTILHCGLRVAVVSGADFSRFYRPAGTGENFVDAREAEYVKIVFAMNDRDFITPIGSKAGRM